MQPILKFINKHELTLLYTCFIILLCSLIYYLYQAYEIAGFRGLSIMTSLTAILIIISQCIPLILYKLYKHIYKY
jgi:hypothetical protein